MRVRHDVDDAQRLRLLAQEVKQTRPLLLEHVAAAERAFVLRPLLARRRLLGGLARLRRRPRDDLDVAVDLLVELARERLVGVDVVGRPAGGVDLTNVTSSSSTLRRFGGDCDTNWTSSSESLSITMYSSSWALSCAARSMSSALKSMTSGSVRSQTLSSSLSKISAMLRVSCARFRASKARFAVLSTKAKS